MQDGAKIRAGLEFPDMNPAAAAKGIPKSAVLPCLNDANRRYDHDGFI